MGECAMITVLNCMDKDACLTKKIRFNDGWQKTGYSNAYTFTSTAYEVVDINELHELLMMLEGVPTACIIRGECISDREIVYRLKDDDISTGRKACFRENPNGVNWLCADFDGVPAPDGLSTSDERLEYLVSLLPDWFHNVSYHFQWSSSAGLNGWDTLNAHIWFMLTDNWTDSFLCERARLENWECDDAVFRTIQPNYTAAPIFEGVADPLEGVRSGLVVKANGAVDLPPYSVPKPCRRVFSKPVAPTERLGELLAEIGPNYHMPIQRAIAYYVRVNGYACDEYELKELVSEAIMYGAPGKSNKQDYLKNSYLDRSIRGAKRKFGGFN